jgi:hypothetical protein
MEDADEKGILQLSMDIETSDKASNLNPQASINQVVCDLEIVL